MAHVMNYQSRSGDTIIVEEEMDYNNIDNTATIIWNFTNRNTGEIKIFSLKIMIHFPEMIMNIINDNGFCIDAVYGGYDFRPLDESSVLQIYKFSRKCNQKECKHFLHPYGNKLTRIPHLIDGGKRGAALG